MCYYEDTKSCILFTSLQISTSLSFRVVKYSSLYLVLFIITYFNSAIWSKCFKKVFLTNSHIRWLNSKWTKVLRTLCVLVFRELNQFYRVHCCESFRLYEFLRSSPYINFIFPVFLMPNLVLLNICFCGNEILCSAVCHCCFKCLILVHFVQFDSCSHYKCIFPNAFICKSWWISTSWSDFPGVQCRQPSASTNHP